MTSVAVYHSSVPNQKNREKIDLLTFFAEGVRRVGDTVIDVRDYRLRQADVGFIQGWISGFPDRPHLRLRDSVVHSQLVTGKYVSTADSNMFLYANTKNPNHYLRYSFNGVFANTGIYCDSDPNPQRWIKISHDMGIELKPYRETGEHILVCLQRNGGWSMSGHNVVEWAANLIITLRQYTDRPIVVRPHPGDKAALGYLGDFNNSEYLKNVRLSYDGASLKDDLVNCWAAINHNSSPVVGAAIEGVPIFVTDPEKSQCREIANTDISQIENPCCPDRQAWVERLAMSHWNFAELRSGEAWAHMRQFIV